MAGSRDPRRNGSIGGFVVTSRRAGSLTLGAMTYHTAVPKIDKVASRSYLRVMLAVGLKTLKNKLAEYVRLVAAGEVVLVTDRERVVAELIPPRTGRSDMAPDALLADAVRKGWVTAPLIVGQVPPAGPPVAALATILAELEQDRGNR